MGESQEQLKAFEARDRRRIAAAVKARGLVDAAVAELYEVEGEHGFLLAEVLVGLAADRVRAAAQARR